MGATNFIKLLKDAGIIKLTSEAQGIQATNAVTSVDADIIFKKITGTLNHVYQ